MRQSNQYTIAFGVALVVVTLFLIIDIQLGQKLSGNYLPIPDPALTVTKYTEDVANRQQITVVNLQNHDDSQKIDEIDTFEAFERNLGLQFKKIDKIRKLIGSRSSARKNVESDGISDSSIDRFTDLQEAVDCIDMTGPDSIEPKEWPTLGHLLSVQPNETATILDKFNYDIKQNELYPKDSETIDGLIHEMATRKISRVEEKTGGSQIKMTMQFDNGMLALAKPMRFPREQQTFENHMLYADYERHSADIAAFHLDRLLGFRRAFPVVGRKLNITTELYNIAEDEFRRTFFTSLQPYSNQCFYGTCHRYCDIYHPVCGENGLIEASFIAFFPVYLGVKNDRIVHPWRKSYNPRFKAIWERDPKYCEKVKSIPPYNEGRRLFDIIDLSVFDFLTGNMDRHHYETMKIFGEETFTIHYDNGRGFGRPYFDELSNLAPMLQCCMIRSSTLKTLLRFHNGPKPLSQLMEESMASDPVAPVLISDHLHALDRRVGIILTALRECIATNSIRDVIYSQDNFGRSQSMS